MYLKSFSLDDVASPKTVSKGVRQSAKLHFRQEDFIKKAKAKPNKKEALTPLGGPEDRVVEGLNDKDNANGQPSLNTPTQDSTVNFFSIYNIIDLFQMRRKSFRSTFRTT